MIISKVDQHCLIPAFRMCAVKFDVLTSTSQQLFRDKQNCFFFHGQIVNVLIHLPEEKQVKTEFK